MNKDIATGQGLLQWAPQGLKRGSWALGDGADLHLCRVAEMLINCFLMKMLSVHLSVHARPSIVNLQSVPGMHMAFLVPLVLRSMAGRSDDTSSAALEMGPA